GFLINASSLSTPPRPDHYLSPKTHPRVRLPPSPPLGAPVPSAPLHLHPGQYGDSGINSAVAAQMQHMSGHRIQHSSGMNHFPGRPDSLRGEDEHHYMSSKAEGQWQWDRDGQRGSTSMASHGFREGQRSDSKLSSEKQVNTEPRAQAHEQEMEVGYEDDSLPQTFEGLERKFIEDLMNLTKEHQDAEDAENARHREVRHVWACAVADPGLTWLRGAAIGHWSPRRLPRIPRWCRTEQGGATTPALRFRRCRMPSAVPTVVFSDRPTRCPPRPPPALAAPHHSVLELELELEFELNFELVYRLNEINAQYQEKLLAVRARQAAHRNEFLRKESQARHQQYQQAHLSSYPSSGPGDPHAFGSAGTPPGALGEGHRPYGGGQFNSYRERDFSGGGRGRGFESRGPYPGGRAYGANNRYY
ncbi:hypothetical protein Taro_031386, partial [Colocasia esculenta]|nr:hypothetical protein [Colocasia esculenta]